MAFDGYVPNSFMQVNPRFIGPGVGNHHQTKLPRHPLDVLQVGIFQVKGAGFHAPEHRLDLPPGPVLVYWAGFLVVRDDELEFGLVVTAFHFTGRQVAAHPASGHRLSPPGLFAHF